MSTQYNAIQAPYDEFRTTSIALIERQNVRETVAPFIGDACVLDLACGSGFYSYHFLQWGASKVVGVDISSAMIEEARAAAQSYDASKTIEFRVADCSKPVQYGGGPFDVVFGAWLLNYAPSRRDLAEVFRNIALNLKDGGTFVGVCPPPRQNPAAFHFEGSKLRPLPTGSGGLYCTVANEVEDGIYLHAHGNMKAGELNFDCYHLRKDVYEAAAKEGGMKGEVKWSETKVPNEYSEYSKAPNGASEKELESYKLVPHYGMLVVPK